MHEYIEDEDIILDFQKIFYTVRARQKAAIISVVILVILAILVTFISPKKYVSSAELYINNSNNTNLIDFNPFIISDLGSEGAKVSNLLGSNRALKNEIEIIQSPLVIDQVIRDNNLKYEKGPKAGKYIPAAAFLESGFSIVENKDADIIEISYKGVDPDSTYQIVSSIINNYKNVKQLMNLQKTANDIDFLKRTYQLTEEELNSQLASLKSSDTKLYDGSAGLNSYLLESFYNVNIKNTLDKAFDSSIENRKIKIKIDRNISKLKMVQEKLDWSELVKKMSKNTSNITILKSPEKKEIYEYSEPKLIINVLIGIVIGIIAAIVSVLILEYRDEKLTYSELGSNVIYHIDKNINELKIIMLSKQDKKVAFVELEGFKLTELKEIDSFSNIKISDGIINNQMIETLKKTDEVIIAGVINSSVKTTHQQINKICKNLSKKVSLEIVKEQESA